MKNLLTKNLSILAAFATVTTAFLPFSASAEEKQVSLKAGAKTEQTEWKPSPIQFFDPDKVESDLDKAKRRNLRAHDYAREQSHDEPVILIAANGKKEFLNAAHYAEKIQLSLRAFGYDAKILAYKSDIAGVSSIKSYYKGDVFSNNTNNAWRSPKDAYAERMTFASHCEKKDQEAQTAALSNDSAPALALTAE